MIDQVRIDRVLQVATSVVWEEDVDCLCAGIGTVICRDDSMVDSMYDVGMWREERVRFDFF